MADGSNITRPLTKRQLAKAATAERVKRAAAERFEADGYELATIRDIAATAGMSTGAIFANFSGKEELYRAIHGHAPISPEAGAELLEALAAIAGGSFPGASNYAIAGDWQGFSTKLQEVARAARAKAEGRS